ncbi:MAG: hypothetical protein ACTSQE_07520 [Candidatus Heimdallarchaeaceae archaeon]
MTKIIQITSDHGYTLGLDNLGNLYRLDHQIKIYNKKGDRYKYQTKWTLLLNGVNHEINSKWEKDGLPF